MDSHYANSYNTSQIVTSKGVVVTNEELKDKLSQIGISKKEFAERFNISQSAVNNWSNKPIPGWVDAVIDLLMEHKKCLEKNIELMTNEDSSLPLDSEGGLGLHNLHSRKGLSIQDVLERALEENQETIKREIRAETRDLVREMLEKKSDIKKEELKDIIPPDDSDNL